MANASSLSNVVSGLVRAQMGSSIPKATLDEELDKRVAELILKEARQKEAKYGRTGSYSPQTSGNVVRTNKRFLTSIIKSTDEHNKTIFKAQAEAANEVKQQREREEREERMRRAKEAVAARTGSSFSSWRSKDDRNYRRHSVSEERHERHLSSRHDRKRERSPHSDAGSDHGDRRNKRRRRDDEQEDRRSASPSRRRDRNGESKSKADRDDDRQSSRKSGTKSREEGDKGRHRPQSRSHSPRRGEDRSSKRKSRHDDSIDAEGKNHTRRHKESKRRRSRSPREKAEHQGAGNYSSAGAKTPSGDEDVIEEENFIGPRPTSPKLAPKGVSSKMDKYFAEDYDPRLDVAPALGALSAKDGLIPPGAFDNWDMMLEIVRVRREEKEERKRLEKLHRSGTSSSKKKDATSVAAPRIDAEDLLSIQYTKRGAVREWDEGKKETT